MRLIIFTLTIFIFSAAIIAQKKTDLEVATNRAEKVTSVLKTFLALGSDSVPFEVFKRAKGIAVFENVTQLSLLLSKGAKGKGLVSIRNSEDWTTPTFADFGSMGFEFKIADKKKLDIVCFIMTQYLIEKLKNGMIKPDELNNHKLALGPIVKGEGGELVLKQASLIYYTFQDGKLSGLEFQSDGLFSGVAIRHDNKLNQSIYQKKAEKILSQNPNDLTTPNAVSNFKQTIIDSLKPKE